MRYTYVAAWAVLGGVFLGEDETVGLFQSENLRFILTRNPDAFLAAADRGAAIRCTVLDGLFGKSEGDIARVLSSATEDIVAERKRKAGTLPVLIFEAHGEVDATVDENRSAEHKGFVVTFDALNKEEIRAAHRPAIEAMKVALASESDSPSRFATLSEDLYLTDDAGRTVYSLTFSMSGSASVATRLKPEMFHRIAARYRVLQSRQDLESVQRLFSQMADVESDRLKAFLSGWAALEILVAKAFKAYEEAFLAPLAEGAPLRERFLQRVKTVMKDKYRLADKFLVVSAVLFPTASDASASDGYERFCRLKQVRDSIYHGEEFSEKDLPVHELAALLRKYAVAYVEAQANG